MVEQSVGLTGGVGSSGGLVAETISFAASGFLDIYLSLYLMLTVCFFQCTPLSKTRICAYEFGSTNITPVANIVIEMSSFTVVLIYLQSLIKLKICNPGLLLPKVAETGYVLLSLKNIY